MGSERKMRDQEQRKWFFSKEILKILAEGMPEEFKVNKEIIYFFGNKYSQSGTL